MDKRGDTSATEFILFAVIALVFAAIATGALLKDSIDAISGSTLEKNYIARDLALIIDAVYAAPGEVSYTYSLRKYSLCVDVEDSKVFIRNAEGIAGIGGSCVQEEKDDRVSYRFAGAEGVKSPVFRMAGIKELPLVLTISKARKSDGSGEVAVTANKNAVEGDYFDAK